jgi:chromosome condensin MukBEF MukE localization factor
MNPNTPKTRTTINRLFALACPEIADFLDANGQKIIRRISESIRRAGEGARARANTQEAQIIEIPGDQ